MNHIHDLARQFEQQIVFFQGYRQAYIKLELAVEATRARGIPTSAVLLGPSGSGKTRLCMIFRDSFPKPYEEISPIGIRYVIPAVYCCVPAKVTLKSFCKTLLESLNCSDTSGDTVDLEFRLVRLLETAKTKIVIIDEFHRLAKHENEKQISSVSDWLLGILNKINIPIIIAGTDISKEIIYQQTQLARRFPYCAELSYFQFDEDSQSDYVTTLRALDDKLYELGSLKKGAHLTDPEICTGLYLASQGNLEYIRQILYSVFKLCLNLKKNHLDRSDFLDACRTIELPLNLAKDNNPFSLDLATSYKLIQRAS